MLPESVRRQLIKVAFGDAFSEACANGNFAVSSLEIATKGWVDSHIVQQNYQAMKQLYQAGGTSFIWPLWMIFGLEQLL